MVLRFTMIHVFFIVYGKKYFKNAQNLDSFLYRRKQCKIRRFAEAFKHVMPNHIQEILCTARGQQRLISLLNHI